ncbi:hypothetical protein HNQ51_001651 [Inhella inkyongensis]|uniref:Uncharacterized protein n=1 Tax=Inhella inkyongensis TaxID=392593 RepID=A0A840RZW2_9BURK|nr:hypothetical protein [Inhella inkyongensis]MBB5204337.1 hypothetical protein [Inhella inkyongensis]
MTPSRFIPLALLTPTLAFAQPADAPWYLGAQLGLTHASNVYRLGNSSPEGQDWIRSAMLLAGARLHLGRQRFYLEGHARDVDYRRNSALHHLEHGLNGGLDWALASRWTGNLSVNSRRSLAPFNAGTLPNTKDKNIETQNQARASVQYGLFGPWRVDAQASWQERDFSLASFDPYEYRFSSVGLGLRWVPNDALQLRLGLRESDGEYPRAQRLNQGYLAEQFDNRSVEASANWQLSGKQSVKLRVSQGTGSRDGGRSSRTRAGGLDWSWLATARLQFNLTGTLDQGSDARDSGFALVENNSTQIRQLKALASYVLAPKLNLDASVSQMNRDISGLSGQTAVDGSDRTRSAALALRWAISQKGQFSCEVATDRRSGRAGFSIPYSARSAGCNLQWLVY